MSCLDDEIETAIISKGLGLKGQLPTAAGLFSRKLGQIGRHPYLSSCPNCRRYLSVVRYFKSQRFRCLVAELSGTRERGGKQLEDGEDKNIDRKGINGCHKVHPTCLHSP
jgi:hypothetical protein